MTRQDENQTTGTSAVEKGLGVLERAWDAQWALRLICVVLFFDMAMLLRARRGLWQWADGGKELLNDVGWLAVAFVAFSFAAAIVIPILVLMLRQLSANVMGWLPTFLVAPTDRSDGRPLGYAPAGKVRDLALHEKDDFLLRMYEVHEQKKRAGRLSLERVGELTAAALLVALADWLLAQWKPGGISLIGVIVEALAGWASLAITVILLCAGFILKWAWFPPYSPDLIYYPPLDRELRDKEWEERRLR